MLLKNLLGQKSLNSLSATLTPQQAWMTGLPVEGTKDIVVVVNTTTKATKKVAKTATPKVAKATKGATAPKTRKGQVSIKGCKTLASIKKEVKALMAQFVPDEPRLLPGFTRQGYKAAIKVAKEVMSIIAHDLALITYEAILQGASYRGVIKPLRMLEAKVLAI